MQPADQPMAARLGSPSYTEPEPEIKLLLKKRKLDRPPQTTTQLTAGDPAPPPDVVQTFGGRTLAS